MQFSFCELSGGAPIIVGMQSIRDCRLSPKICSIMLGMSLLTIGMMGYATTQNTQCQFSPHLKCSDINGVELWAKPGLSNAGKLIIDAKRIYLNQNNQVFSFDRTNGKAIWKVSSGSKALYFFPILNQQAIYLARSDGKLEKRHADNGKLQWSKQTSRGWIYPPVIIHDKLITGGQDRTILVIDSETAKIETRTPLNQELVMPLTSSHELIFASTFDRTISAYELKGTTNSQIVTVWESDVTSPVFDIQAGQNTLIAADMGGVISSIDPMTGQLNWRQPVHSNARYWNVLHQHTIYSLSESGLLSSLDISSGTLLSQQQFTGTFDRSPIVQGESLTLFDMHGKPKQIVLKKLTSQAATLLTFNQKRMQK